MRCCDPSHGGGVRPASRQPEGNGARRTLFLAVLTLGYAAGAALFFCKGAALPCKAAYPAAWLAAGLFVLRERAVAPVACALLLSAAGDAAGAMHEFLLQMGFFALAHTAYIVHFLPSADFSLRRLGGAAAAGVGMLLFVLLGIVPHVGPAVERAGVAVYGGAITAMALGAWLYRGRGRTAYIAAAALFVFSDATIAWNKFVAPVSGAEHRIMLTYYAAQYLFALTALLGSRPFRSAD